MISWGHSSFSSIFGKVRTDSDQILFHFDDFNSPFGSSKEGRIWMFFSDFSCPSSHKYAYLDGKYCCRTNKEKNDSRLDGDLCDGSEIGIDSRCCENDDHVDCEYAKCINHKDAIKNDQGYSN